MSTPPGEVQPLSTWFQVILGFLALCLSVIIHAFAVTWIAGWKLGYNYRKMQEFGELTNRNAVDIIRLDKTLSALTGVSNGVNYREG